MILPQGRSVRDSEKRNTQGGRLFHHLSLHIRRNKRSRFIENGILVNLEGGTLKKR